MTERKKQDRPTKADPRGVIYIISAEALYGPDGRPRNGRHYTKIGLSRNRLQKGAGRQQTADFWLEALGLGQIQVHKQFEHPRAFYLEKKIHSDPRLTLNEDCGKSKESFNISGEEAVRIVEEVIKDFPVA